MLDIVQSNVSPLRDRFASSNTNGHILEICIARELSKSQWLIQSCLGRVREAESRCLGAIGVESDDREGAALCETGGSARVGAEAVIKAFKVER